MNTNKMDVFASVIYLPPIIDEHSIAYISDTHTFLHENFSNYEFVIILDGIAQHKMLDNILATLSCIRVISLTRTFGQDAAILSGLESVIWDIIILLWTNQIPSESILNAATRHISSQNIIFWVSTTKLSPVGHAIASIFHFYCKRSLRISLPVNTTGFLILSRQHLLPLLRMKESTRSILLLTSYTGFKFETTPQNFPSVVSQMGILRSIQQGLDIIITNSLHPLRIAWLLCVISLLLNGTYTLYVVWVLLFNKEIALWWASQSLQNIGQFSLIFIVLFIMSEYLGRTLQESKRRPSYFIQEEKNSSVLISNITQLNINHFSIWNSSK